jgi:hypothetical protein
LSDEDYIADLTRSDEDYIAGRRIRRLARFFALTASRRLDGLLIVWHE